MALQAGIFMLYASLSAATVADAQADPVQTCPAQFAEISAAAARESMPIRDGGDWTNPYVMVSGDGYELILHGRPRNGQRMDLSGLRQSLLELPTDEWPLGRVVAVQGNPLASGSEHATRAKRLAGVRTMLDEMCIRSDLWPTA